MAWTEEQTKAFQMSNNEQLAELNKTLKGIDKNKLNLGIFCPGQAGDLITVLSFLKYSDTMYPYHNIIFFTNFPNADNLRFAPISEVRPYPWAGNGLEIGTPDFYPLLCDNNNQLNKKLASQYELTKDLDFGFFPTPWMVAPEKQDGIDYPNVSRHVFGIPDDFIWHPFLTWSDEEKEMVRSMMDCLPKGRKNILIENYCGSGQSAFWDENATRKIMKTCRDKLGSVNFIFASHKSTGINGSDIMNSIFFDDDGCIGLEKLTVRQAALAINYCDFMVCLSSGISVATSAYGLKPVTKLQWCGSRKCSTVALATGRIELVENDFKTREVAEKEFFGKLEEILTGQSYSPDNTWRKY